MLCRENYCALVVGLAAGIAGGNVGQVGSQPEEIPAVQMSSSEPKPPTSEIGVGTEDLPFTPPTGAPKDGKNVPPKDGKSEKPQKKAPPPAPEDDAGSDILGLFFGMMVSTMFSLFSGIFIKTPLRIIYYTFCLAVAFFLLAAIKLQFEDHPLGINAMDEFHNMPGII